MQRVLVGWILLLLAAVSTAGETGRLEVRVDAIRNDQGQVFVSLFNTAEGFPGGPEAAVTTLNSKPVNGLVTVTFPDMPYGDYAIAAFHDEDGNGKLKTVYGTIPVEGIGISRDAKGVMGPPQFKDASFRLAGAELKVDVSIRY